ncbi:MAG: signal peptidase II [Clostridia bacterium]|nr:signal peptidase II [Clostridia bacterium]
MIFVFLIAALCIGADQLTKYLAVTALYPDGSVDVIPGILRFTYVENRGAAFGSLSDQRWIFLVFSTVLIIVLIGYTLWKKPAGWLERISIGLLIGGGIGNMIDRIALGYVVDFIDFCAFPELWKWVFNGADTFVCIGTALLMIWVMISDGKQKKSVLDTTENAKGRTENDEAE